MLFVIPVRPINELAEQFLLGEKKFLSIYVTLDILWYQIDGDLTKFLLLSTLSWIFLYLYKSLISIFDPRISNGIFISGVFLTLYYYSFEQIYENFIPYVIKFGILTGKFKYKDPKLIELKRKALIVIF
ncbi:hypothetical protein MXB_2903 [Myxobolus squamalis]|nr:hypothetical protein MXB_2903 [Myxobolus squamalis]